MYITRITKTALFLSLIVLGFITMSSFSKSSKTNPPVESIYDISLISLDGSALDLNEFKGKKILFVNTASKCGFTPQYEALQKLHEMHGDKVQIVGLPCNQFLGQEPGSHEEIASFCQKNYGVSFQMTEKIDVKGKNQHPLYQWLTNKEKNGSEDSSVKWNFQKYLVNENGELQAVFAPKTDPLSDEIIAAISH